MDGPKIIFTIPLFGGIAVTETVTNSWLLIVVVFILCKFLTSNLQKIPKGKQVLAEKYVTMITGLVKETMGEKKLHYAPYIGTLMIFSALGSLMSLTGLRPVTGDLNTTVAWAVVTFVLIQMTKIKANGFLGYLKSFADPFPVMLPINIVSELATPVSLSFRHFGNIAAGTVITSLLYTALAALTNIVFRGFMPVPIFQLGIPAVLSIYFDLFTGFMQAFIFSMLTMAFISNAAE